MLPQFEGMGISPELMAQLMAGLQARGVPVAGTGDFAGAAASSSRPGGSSSSSAHQGCSRKYREDAGWQLSGPFGSLAGGGAVLTTTSPVVPLKFEQPPGQWQSECGQMV